MVLSAILAVAVAAPSGVSHYAAPILHKTVHYAEPLHATVVKPELERRTYVEVEPQVHVVDTPVVKKVADVVESIPTAVSHQSSTIVHNKEHIVRPVLAHGYEKTVVEGTPIVKTYHEDTPVLKTYTAPIGYTAPLAYSAPLTYAHHYEPHVYAAPALRYGW